MLPARAAESEPTNKPGFKSLTSGSKDADSETFTWQSAFTLAENPISACTLLTPRTCALEISERALETAERSTTITRNRLTHGITQTSKSECAQIVSGAYQKKWSTLGCAPNRPAITHSPHLLVIASGLPHQSRDHL